MFQRILLITVSALALSSAASAQQAASSSSGGLDEITVTAQRRVENIQNVPVAVTAFSGKDLEAGQITSTVEVAKLVPNFESENNVGQGSANVYYIRGMGQTESFPTFEPQVGTYIDDIYIGRQNANNFALFDVDQLEVLRGPQGTLFGRNSTGGAVVVNLNKPSSSFGGTVEGGYGSWNRLSGRGSVDIPINPQFLTKTSFYGIHDDGYVKNLTTGQNENAVHNYGVREGVRILPAAMDNLTWDITADYSNSNSANNDNFLGPNGRRISYSGYSNTPGGLAPYLTGKKGQRGEGVDVQSWGAMSNIAVAFDAGTLNIITGMRGLHQELNIDFPDGQIGPLVPYDTVPYGQFGLAQDLFSYEYTQELKWSGKIGKNLTYTAGLYYLSETNRDNWGDVANLAGVIPGFPFNSLPVVLNDEFTRNTTDSKAGYVQADYAFTDDFSVTAGGRYTNETKNVHNVPLTSGPSGYTDAEILADGWKTQLTTDQFTPHFSAQYQVNPELMVYASATRGFQGGGWNGLSTAGAATFNNFNPETIWSYEAGTKFETADKKLRFNSNFFYEDIQHYQLLASLSSSANFSTTNSADVIAYGLESQLTWRPIDPLTINATLGLENGYYSNPVASIQAQEKACQAAPGPLNGNCATGIVTAAGQLAPLAQTAPINASLSATYTSHLDGFSLISSIGGQMVGRHQVSTFGAVAGVQNTYAQMDVGVTLQPDNQPWHITAECKNCTMTNYATTYVFNYNYLNTPGSWDVRVSYAF